MAARPSIALASGRGLLLAALLLALFRLWLAAFLPMTGDEAYFIVWGQQLAGGYYDHPPLIGWWLNGLLAAGHAAWWLRLPSVLVPFVLAWGAWWLLRPHGDSRARFAALLVLLQPADVWNILITTDTPVVILCFLSALAYVQACRRPSWHWPLLAGALLGLAFLGKYFAALLGFAFAAHLLIVRRDRARWGHLVLLTAAALLGPAWNLWWNAEHCWVNILFNFYNRTSKSGFAWQNPLVFLGSLLYLATPWLLWALWRARREWVGLRDDTVRAAVWLGGGPLLFFFAISFVKAVGLHWLLAFVPMLAVIAAAVLPVATLGRLARWSALFALLHVVAVIAAMSLPLSLWKGSSLYPGVVMTVRAPAVAAALREPLAQCGEGCTLAMEGYSSAAILAYAAERPVAVFGTGSKYGRQDDFDTDWRSLDGRDFVILRKEPLEDDAYTPFFDSVEFSVAEIDGVAFNVVQARGFRYAPYRDRVLKRVREQYYRFPKWLPLRGCVFTDRYFPEGGS